MNDLTPTQRRTVQTWFEDLHDRREQYDVPINFIRVVLGDKPATCVSQSDWKSDRKNDASPFDSVDEFLAFIEDLGLFHHHHTNDSSHTISNSAWRLDILPSMAQYRSSTALHRRLGIVFGYPRKDIEWFVSDERTGLSPRDRVNNGEFTPEEMAFIDFLAYRNEGTVDGYERAIDEGQRIRTLLSEVADKWDLPIIDRIVQNHYQLSVEVYSGERKGFPHELVDFKMIARGD